MKKIKRFLSGLFAFALLFSTMNLTVYALSESDISVTSPASGYYLPSESISYSVEISGASNNPATVKVLYPYDSYNSQPRSTLKTLSRSGTSYTYTGSSSPPAAVWVPGKKVGSHSAWQTRGFCIQATKDGTTVTKRAPGYITFMRRAEYEATDSTFWYTNSTSHPFRGVGTPGPGTNETTYNCLAYAVSIYTSWEWPWGNRNPTQEELDAYMAKSGKYSSRGGDSFVPSTLNGCNVIYYSDSNWGSGSDGHLARVIAWDSSGNPTMISSKWGRCEVIESTSYDPFSTGTGSYGAPKRYYKYQ